MTFPAKRCALFFIAAFAVCPQSRATYIAHLHVAGWTSEGERVERIWILLTSLYGKESYSGNGRDVDLSVPTGKYTLQVSAPGFESQRQLVRVYQPDTLCTVMLPVVWLHGQKESSLSGKLRGNSSDISKVRIRLVALYGGEIFEGVPDRVGNFVLPANPGIYTLMTVIDKEREPVIADWRVVHIKRGEAVNVTVDLARNPN